MFKHIGELREETYKKYGISFGGHLAELAKIRDDAKKSRSFSAATNAEKSTRSCRWDCILNKK